MIPLEKEGIGEEDSGVVQSDDDDRKCQFAGAGAGRHADGEQRAKELDRLGIRDVKRGAGHEMAMRFGRVGYSAGTRYHGGPQGLECEPEQISAAAIPQCLEHPDMRQQDGVDTECGICRTRP